MFSEVFLFKPLPVYNYILKNFSHLTIKNDGKIMTIKYVDNYNIGK